MSNSNRLSGRLFNRATCPGLCGSVENFSVPFVGKVFLAAITIESLLMWSLSITLLAVHDEYNAMGQIYAGLGAFCTLGLLYFAYDAILSENVFQFIACQITSVMYTFFLLWQVFRNPDTLGPAWHDIRFEVMGVKLAFQLFYWVAAKRVWESFGFFTWKIAGGSVQLKEMYNRYRIFLTLIKFDMFVAIVLFFLVSVYLINTHQADFYLGILSLVASIVFLIVGWYAITKERKGTLAAFFALSLLQPAYIVFKSWSIEAQPQYVPANVTLTQFAVLGSLSVLLRVAVVVSAWRCYKDFGNGLQQTVLQGKHAAVRQYSVRRSSGDAILAQADHLGSLNKNNENEVTEEVVVGTTIPAAVQPPQAWY